MMPIILTVYLNKGEHASTEVPITPETTCRSVVEFCRAPGETSCHLVEVWQGSESAIPFDTLMCECLEKWGPLQQDVKFFLCHDDMPSEAADPGTQLCPNQVNWKNGGNPEVICENVEQQLRYINQQEHWQQQALSESEKLVLLKERVDSQEAKLRKIRALRGQADGSPKGNGNLSAEIEHLSGLFLEKQQELQMAMEKVEQLTGQLEKLRKTNQVGQVTGIAALELSRIYQELQIRSKLNQDSKRPQHKELLEKRNLKVVLMDRRIAELRERLHKRKAEAGQKGDMHLNKLNLQHTIGSSGQGTTVSSYIQIPIPDPVKPQPVLGTNTLSRPKTTNADSWPAFKSPDYKGPSLDTTAKSGSTGFATTSLADKGLESCTIVGSLPAATKPLPPPYGSCCGTNPLSLPDSMTTVEGQKGSVAWPAWPRSTPSTGSSSQQIQQRITVPPSPVPQPNAPAAMLPMSVRQLAPDKGSQSPRKGPATMNSTSIYHMYLQRTAPKSCQANNKPAIRAIYGKPVIASGSMPSSPMLAIRGISGSGGGVISENGPTEPPSNVESLPRPLSPTKLTPVAHSPLRYNNEGDSDIWRRRLANAPRPLKKRGSITEPEGPSGPNIQKLLYQRFNTLAGGMEQPILPPNYLGGSLADADNGNLSEAQPHKLPDDNRNQLLNQPLPEIASTEDSNNNNRNQDKAPGTRTKAKESDGTINLPKTLEKRTNLKKPDSQRSRHGLRVQFSPLALLLDASLEGEFDLVQRIIYEVDNPSMPNDEGITPLHNAVCAGHYHIVKFLLDFGVNVNAADSDGWTPLHCAASCNSVQLCKLLVESGAAIFATTISDVETATNKCEEMEEGYVQCSQFLSGVQEKLGVMNKGVVYALWDYEAQSPDELSFHEGDSITILRRKDDNETEWWWGGLTNREGYVPHNLLGLYPRIKPRQRSLA